MNNYDKSFKKFALSLQKILLIYNNNPNDKNFTKRQKEQIDTLVKLEKQFKRILIKDQKGKRVYKKFIEYITEDKRNILAARPYFRERQKFFSARISPAIKRRSVNKLQKFAINYLFIIFVLGCEKWPKNGKLNKTRYQIEKLRNEIVEINLPFAISNAKIFWTKTPKSHLAYMDLIQMATEGLINAIDKFVPPYTPVFRSVAIGRMKGNFMENYNDTMLHFYPSDKKKLYRAHKSRRRLDSDIDKIADEVNQKGKDDNLQTTPSEISELMSASSHVSLDTMSAEVDGDDENSLSPLNKISSPVYLQPDNQVEEFEATNILYKEIDTLNTLERKILKMKGLNIK